QPGRRHRPRTRRPGLRPRPRRARRRTGQGHQPARRDRDGPGAAGADRPGAGRATGRRAGGWRAERGRGAHAAAGALGDGGAEDREGAGADMSTVLVECAYAPPASAEAIAADVARVRGCLVVREVEVVAIYVAENGRRAVHVLRARDAESVRNGFR